jgi:hypothetical protein
MLAKQHPNSGGSDKPSVRTTSPRLQARHHSLNNDASTKTNKGDMTGINPAVMNGRTRIISDFSTTKAIVEVLSKRLRHHACKIRIILQDIQEIEKAIKTEARVQELGCLFQNWGS